MVTQKDFFAGRAQKWCVVGFLWMPGGQNFLQRTRDGEETLLQLRSQTRVVGTAISKVSVASCSSISWIRHLRCSKEVLRLRVEDFVLLLVF